MYESNDITISLDNNITWNSIKIKNSQLYLLISTLCFILLIKNLFILRLLRPTGYTVDVYSIIPLHFLFGFIICYFIATFLVLNGKKILGAAILCLNHLVILLIPYMLGYYSMGRADDMSYIGEYSKIASSSHLANWDIYPASHIIGANISILSNLEAHYVSFIIPIIFSFIFIVGMYLLSRELISDPFIVSLALVSSFILYLGIYNFLNAPHSLFFSFMPLYLLYMHKYFRNSRNISLSIIFILFTLIVSFTHPFIVFFVFVVGFSCFISTNSSIPVLNTLRIPKFNLFSLLILIFSFATWFIYDEFLMTSFKISYDSFIRKNTEPAFLSATTYLARIDLGFSELVKFVSFFYGRFILPTIFILVSLIIVYFNKKYMRKELIGDYSYLVFLYVIFMIIQIILLFNPLITHQPDRLTNLNFVVYAQIPLFAYALYILFFINRITIRKILLISGLLAAIWGLSLFGCFDSPSVCRTNLALTYNEVHGMEWFYQVKANTNISVPLSQINRFHDLLGHHDIYDQINQFPDHFGYSNTLSLKLNENSYIIILTIDELLYQKVNGFKNVGRYNGADYIKFRNDKLINKIYDSSNIDVFWH